MFVLCLVCQVVPIDQLLVWQIDQHPGGGARIMLAAGGAIDPFWAMYAQHQTAEVRKILEGYRIGNLVSSSCMAVLHIPCGPSTKPLTCTGPLMVTVLLVLLGGTLQMCCNAVLCK